MKTLARVVMVVTVVLAACATGPATPLPTVLVGTQWKLVSLKGKPPLAGTTITLAFASGILRTLSGSDGCNTYGGPDSGPYQATIDGGLTVSETAVTAMLCLGPPSGITEQATEYMNALHAAAAYRV